MRKIPTVVPTILITVVFVLMLGANGISGQVMTGGPYRMTSSVQASGGGASTGSGNKTIEGTAGQAAAGGPYANSIYSHDAGFWPTTVASAAAPTPTPTPTPTPGSTPSVSISDVTQVEGNSGATTFSFLVTLSAASLQTISVNYASADMTATAGSDYQTVTGSLNFAPGEISKPLTVTVNGDTQNEADESFVVNLFSPVNVSIGKDQGVGTIVNDDSVPPSKTIQFSQSAYSVQEELGALTVTVTRSGDTSAGASVDYQTVDGSSAQKTDFEYAAGTLIFAPGETAKTFTLLINEDSYLEGNESFSLMLSNPVGGSLGTEGTAAVTIIDDPSEPAVNTVDDPQSFVYLHYHDFLNREPDAAGLAFWTDQITSCGANQTCIDSARANVSAAFYLSIEFQQTGYLLYLMQKESYATMPSYAAFMRDLQEISRGVVVKSPGWQQKLSDNQAKFAEAWANRAEFKAVYDGLSNDAYVNTLYANAGIVPAPAERNTLVSGLNTASIDRSAVLLEVANNAAFRQQQQNAAFVLMEYFGYLRRNPNEAPEPALNFDGYNFWLNKLNQFGGNYLDAEMVKAFIISSEYRHRFGF